MKQKKILVTGANGYIGQYLGELISRKDYNSLGTIRFLQKNKCLTYYDDIQQSGNIDKYTEWNDLLCGVDFVVHLAGVAHKIKNKKSKKEINYTKVNRDGTIRLAEQAAALGVKRFIYISSIGVLGDKTYCEPFNNKTPYNPMNLYTHSKMEAEKALTSLSTRVNMDIIILRPPLIYGPGAPGNFGRLLKLCSSNKVLPFGAFTTPKNMISLENICDLIIHCFEIDLPKNRIFVVADKSNWSVVDLIFYMGKFLDNKVYNLYCPISLLLFFTAFIGKAGDIIKLRNSLHIDSNDTWETLKWYPPQDPLDGLLKAIDHFKNTSR